MHKALLALLIAAPLAVAACVKARPAADTGDAVGPAAPTGPSGSGSTANQPLAYDPDMKAIFASDCTTCHGLFRVDGNYRMNTYQFVMQDVRAGNAASKLVVDTQPGGSMYRYWSGTRNTKANLVFQWVVTYKAAETR